MKFLVQMKLPHLSHLSLGLFFVSQATIELAQLEPKDYRFLSGQHSEDSTFVPPY